MPVEPLGPGVSANSACGRLTSNWAAGDVPAWLRGPEGLGLTDSSANTWRYLQTQALTFRCLSETVNSDTFFMSLCLHVGDYTFSDKKLEIVFSREGTL